MKFQGVMAPSATTYQLRRCRGSSHIWRHKCWESVRCVCVDDIKWVPQAICQWVPKVMRVLLHNKKGVTNSQYCVRFYFPSFKLMTGKCRLHVSNTSWNMNRALRKQTTFFSHHKIFNIVGCLLVITSRTRRAHLFCPCLCLPIFRTETQWDWNSRSESVRDPGNHAWCGDLTCQLAGPSRHSLAAN
jgi:hypothetical protein